MFGGMANKISILAKKGSAASDVTPNAIDWDIVDFNAISGEYLCSQAQITGINQTITLRVDYTYGSLFYGVFASDPGLTAGSISDPYFYGLAPISDLDTFTVSNNDYVVFTIDGTGVDFTDTVTIINVTDSNTTLDTFSSTSTGNA